MNGLHTNISPSSPKKFHLKTLVLLKYKSKSPFKDCLVTAILV